MMDSLEEKYHTTTRGFRYRYYITSASQANDASKPILLLTHGWPDGAMLWKDIIPYLLPSKLRLVVPDLLGFGKTSHPTDPKVFEVKAMSQDIMEIIDSENITAPIIPLGHDWGAYFASRFYMLHKSRMAGLITLSVALMLPAPPQPFSLDGFNALTEKAFGYPAYAYWSVFSDPNLPKEIIDPNLNSLWHAMHGSPNDWMIQLFCTKGAMHSWLLKDRTDVELRPYARNEKLRDEWFSSVREGGGLTSACCWYRATREDIQTPIEQILDPKVEHPYLFIGCDGDAVCRTDYIEQAKDAGAVPDLEFHELHSGHWCPYEKPNEIGKIVMEWLGKKAFVV